MFATMISKPQDQKEVEEAMTGFSIKNVAQDACDNMKQEDMKNMHFSNKEECVDGMQ